MKYEVGQVVWVELASRGWGRSKATPEPMEVTRVGRKWVELQDGRYRFDKDSRSLDGGNSGYGSPGTVYLTRESWAAEEAFGYAWRRLQTSVREMRPAQLTLQDIQDAANALRITLPEWQDPETQELKA